MRHRIALWAGAGFLIASCFVLFTFLVPPESLISILHSAAGKAIAFLSAPLVFAVGRHYPIAFWWVPPSSALTYAMAGLVAELLRHMSHSRIQPAS